MGKAFRCCRRNAFFVRHMPHPKEESERFLSILLHDPDFLVREVVEIVNEAVDPAIRSDGE
jgi:hypothetical protein